MTTTAQYRALAQAAEKALDWTQAAYCWDCAVEAYPSPAGALAKLDLAKMTARRDGARRQAEQEAKIDTSDVNWVGHPTHY